MYPPNGDDRRTVLQRRYTRLLVLVGVGLAVVVPLVMLVIAVETGEPVLGLVGLLLAAMIVVLLRHR